MNPLTLIKIIHTLFWALFAGCILYLDWMVLVNRIDTSVYIAIGLVLLESVTLIAFGWKCPLTIIAEKYTDDRSDNFDIYLPSWLAKHNKSIFSTL